jgi:hypothetical protein
MMGKQLNNLQEIGKSNFSPLDSGQKEKVKLLNYHLQVTVSPEGTIYGTKLCKQRSEKKIG